MNESLHHKLPLFLFCLCLFFGCNKAVVRSQDRPQPPIQKTVKRSFEETFAASKKALTSLGYEISQENAEQGILKTRWESTKATSHYTELFDQRDYGTIGAYYHLDVHLRRAPSKTEVVVSAPLRSITGHQKSTYSEEKKFLKKMADILRRDDFEMTNLGASE